MGMAVEAGLKKSLIARRRRLKSLADGRLRTGPEFVRIGVSRTCNFNCLTCWYHSPLIRNKKIQKTKTVLADEGMVTNLINELADMGCFKILFSGAGEPFCHPKMMDFIKLAVKRDIKIVIQTNLSIVDAPELAKALRPNSDLVCVNLSAATPATYHRLHPNIPGTLFKDILNKISYLRKKRILVRLVYVISKVNYHEIKDIFKLTFDLGARLHLELADFDPNGEVKVWGIDDRSKRRLIDKIEEIKKRPVEPSLVKTFLNRGVKNNLDRLLSQLKYDGLGIKDINSCQAGYFLSTINESGDVYYCFNRQKDYYLGNLRESGFRDIWRSARYQELRLKFLKGNFIPPCTECLKKRGFNFKVHGYINVEKSASLEEY
jgi:radical SAM protein with 4Fe4S-binding SPASM domain